MFSWGLRHCQPDLRIMMVLHNWGNEDAVDTIGRSRNYTRHSWCRPQGNPTFDHMFYFYWSRKLILKRDCLPLNALWGLKLGKSLGSSRTHESMPLPRNGYGCH